MSAFIGNRLSWEDNNDFEDGFNIYRSLTPFDRESLPVVYETLPPNTTTYLDTDVIMGGTYYYMVSTFVGSIEVFALNLMEITVNYIPETVGDAIQGGIYIGNITIPSGIDAGVYAIIMAGIEGQSPTTMKWKVRNDDTPNTASLVDGLANTYAMVTAGIDDHPAAKWCIDYAGGGYNDWYLPAKDEIYLTYVNRFELAALDLLNVYLWSSSQVNATNASIVGTGDGHQGSGMKTGTYKTRPVRRLKISDI